MLTDLEMAARAVTRGLEDVREAKDAMMEVGPRGREFRYLFDRWKHAKRVQADREARFIRELAKGHTKP